ncbi:lipopolysaccharide biosynthesis protein [Flavobacterium sp. GT3R68]|uniref:lipopolysaccharide biosynthesis protein n=1 Tax=Flavobacterium sp. GT3R68 TaxID=2594437 RepID=UPI000F86DFEA|nr:oligosaccharide flippase family protein [Flavobacterium sp. GT3R68]RTY92298.1 sugar translocase [Flavobacterium sp. GSN2]TRW92534.1 oligosaccharide flippase family protein [Flavobacterium sp. GT3R68]
MNENSRISNSLKNISFGLMAQLIQMILGFICRTIFIKYLAVEYLGVNGLFTNVLSLLSLAELGIGSAMLYALYQPIADKDHRKMAALVRLYGKIYMVIAGVIAIGGLLFVPFLDNIVINPPQKIAEDLTVIYLLFLFNTVSTYFFYFKLSLFQADQRSHIISKSNTVVFILQNTVQIAVLLYYQNFILYLAIQSVFQLCGNLVISFLVNKYYPFLNKYKDEKVDAATKKQIISNIKSTALIKIGGLLVNNTDNLILNYFSGLVMVGLLSNYNLLIGLVSGLIMQVFAGLTASIANVNLKESHEKKIETFNMVNFANFWVFGLASVFMIVLLNDFIQLWIGAKFILPLSVILALVFNFYIYGMQNAVWTFKATLGYFKQGQYLIILTAIINLVLSFVLGSYLGLLGILIATAIARLATNAWYDPYIIHILALQINPITYVKKYIKYLLLLLVSLLLIFGISYFLNFSLLINMILKGFLCLIIPNIIIYLFFKKDLEFQALFKFASGLFLKLAGKK